MEFLIGTCCPHDDVIKWEHFPRYWPFVRGSHRSPVKSPHKGQWRGTLMFPLISALNKPLSKHSWGWWFETQSPSSWRHYNVTSGDWPTSILQIKFPKWMLFWLHFTSVCTKSSILLYLYFHRTKNNPNIFSCLHHWFSNAVWNCTPGTVWHLS